MTYTEWRDELKSNLLCVSENERRRVLDYYAEAYADRREAGFTEREIIADFGAPYDAAQRILYEKVDDDYSDEQPSEPTRRDIRRENRERRREEQTAREQVRGQNARGAQYAPPPPPPPQYQPPQTAQQPQTATAAPAGNDYTWVFVLLCVIFCVPLFSLILGMVIATVCVCVAPIALICAGVFTAGTGVVSIFGAGATNGIFTIGVGLIIFGVGIALCPLCFKLVGLMWKLFTKVFGWIKSLFSGKEAVK